MKDSEILEILNRLKTQNDKRLSELVMDLINETQLLKQEAYQDNLTKVYNRKILSENPQYDVLVMCDLDNFKEINDQHGHKIGDEVLKDVSTELKLMIRSNDIICRYGGDEFTILFKDCTVENIINRLEYLGNKIKEFEANKGINLTLSFGLAERQDDKTLDEIINNADKALYESKNTGKNRITVFNTSKSKQKRKETNN